MRRLDAFGMVLMIISANFFVVAFFFFITFPRITEVYLPRLYTSFRVLIGVLLIIGALTFIIGSTSRLVDDFQEKKRHRYSSRKEEKTEIEIIDDIIDYLRNNAGKAFTIDALLNRVYEENQIEIKQNTLEKLLQQYVISNIIRSQFKDGENFYLF